MSIDSPHARAPGTFSWEATLWHELAHVVTLQMSNQRVPRWLTEGISVYEEGRARPEWGRDMEVPFAVALEQGKTLKLKDLNSGFTKPDTIALAYFEASLLVDHIVASRGEAALRNLLLTYGKGVEGDAAIQEGLGVSIDQLQTTFDGAVDARFASIRSALRDQRENARGQDVTALRAAAAATPGSYRAQLALGQALAEQGDKAAFEPLEKAAALIPVAIGEGSPHAVMGRLAEKLGDPGEQSRNIARCWSTTTPTWTPPGASRRSRRSRATRTRCSWRRNASFHSTRSTPRRTPGWDASLSNGRTAHSPFASSGPRSPPVPRTRRPPTVTSARPT